MAGNPGPRGGLGGSVWGPPGGATVRRGRQERVAPIRFPCVDQDHLSPPLQGGGKPPDGGGVLQPFSGFSLLPSRRSLALFFGAFAAFPAPPGGLFWGGASSAAPLWKLGAAPWTVRAPPLPGATEPAGSVLLSWGPQTRKETKTPPCKSRARATTVLAERLSA